MGIRSSFCELSIKITFNILNAKNFLHFKNMPPIYHFFYKQVLNKSHIWIIALMNKTDKINFTNKCLIFACDKLIRTNQNISITELAVLLFFYIKQWGIASSTLIMAI